MLTSGGHNAGIVSEPGHPHRSFQLLRRPAGAAYLGPDAWLEQAPHHEGSWWPAWVQWLDERSGEPIEPPRMGAPTPVTVRRPMPPAAMCGSPEMFDPAFQPS